MIKFVTDVFSEDDANVVAFGVDAPESLREASRLVEPFDIIERKNLLQNAKIYDAGDTELVNVESKVKSILANKKIPLILAKEHTVTLHAMRAMASDTRLVVFDAHPDLKDEYEGSKFSHACWLRRLCETFDCKNVVIVGVRSGEKEELEFMEDNGIRYFTSKKIKQSPQKVVQELKNFLGDFNVYVSLDMDIFDPSIAPAVKYPEPGGILYRDFLSLLEALGESKLVGADCVEIRPIVGNKITESLAVMSLFKILSKYKT
jgi:agmatinase